MIVKIRAGRSGARRAHAADLLSADVGSAAPLPADLTCFVPLRRGSTATLMPSPPLSWSTGPVESGWSWW
jgi:hypothetical protein